MTSRLNHSDESKRRGPAFALIAAALFGFSTPIAKLLLGNIQPVLLAALLYLGSGIGLVLWLLIRRFVRTHEEREAGLTQTDLPWLASAIIFGGIIAPILLLAGLRWTPVSSVALTQSGRRLHRRAGMVRFPREFRQPYCSGYARDHRRWSTAFMRRKT